MTTNLFLPIVHEYAEKIAADCGRDPVITRHVHRLARLCDAALVAWLSNELGFEQFVSAKDGILNQLTYIERMVNEGKASWIGDRNDAQAQSQAQS